MNAIDDIWRVVYEKIVDKYPSTVIDLWFKNFELVYFDGDKAVITTTSDGFIDILNKKYAPEIEQIFKEALTFPVKVHIFAKANFNLEAALADEAFSGREKEEAVPAPEPPKEAEAEFPVDTPKDGNFVPETNFTFENFIVGSSNKMAYAASIAVAKQPTAYNPLFIYGSSGIGKTHLMKAVANRVKENNPTANIILIKGEDFTNELVRSIEKKTTVQFKEKYRNCDMLLIDDIQFIAGKVSTQEEFFHTFNSLYDAGKQIILTSDRPPKDIQHLEERIQSRFEGGLIVDIQPPDTELRIAILKSKAKLMKVELSDDVLNYLGENVTSNIRQLEGVIKKLGAYHLVNGTRITVEVASNVLSSVISGAVPPALVAEQIIENIATRYNVSVEDIKGKKRVGEIAMARHIAIYVIRRVTNLSLKTTAKLFGRDHSTIHSSVNVVETRMKEDSSFEYEIRNICESFS